MLTSDRITPRPAQKTAPASVSHPSRIEEIGTRLAEIVRQYNELDGASIRLSYIGKRATHGCGPSEEILIDAAMERLHHEQLVLEETLSVSQPETAFDLLITTAACAYRMDTIGDIDLASDANQSIFDKDCAVIENTIERQIRFLEKLAGVTLADLGFGTYFLRDETPEVLLASVASLEKSERERLPAISGFTGAEPISNPEEYEFLKERLKRVMIAWKAIEDLDAQEDEDPARIALIAVANKAELEIADLPANSLAVSAAKVVVSEIHTLRNNLAPDGGQWTMERLNAEAAMNAIEWFGLKELYDSYLPEGFGLEEARGLAQ